MSTDECFSNFCIADGKKRLRHQIKGMWRGDKGNSPQNLECGLHFQLNQNFYTVDESRLAETSELC